MPNVSDYWMMPDIVFLFSTPLSDSWGYEGEKTRERDEKGEQKEMDKVIVSSLLSVVECRAEPNIPGFHTGFFVRGGNYMSVRPRPPGIKNCILGLFWSKISADRLWLTNIYPLSKYEISTYRLTFPNRAQTQYKTFSKSIGRNSL